LIVAGGIDLAVGLPRLAVDAAGACHGDPATVGGARPEVVEGVANGEAGFLIDVVQLGVAQQDVAGEPRAHEIMDEPSDVHVVMRVRV